MKLDPAPNRNGLRPSPGGGLPLLHKREVTNAAAVAAAAASAAAGVMATTPSSSTTMRGDKDPDTLYPDAPGAPDHAGTCLEEQGTSPGWGEADPRGPDSPLVGEHLPLPTTMNPLHPPPAPPAQQGMAGRRLK